MSGEYLSQAIMANEGYESLLTEVTMPGPDTEDDSGYKNMFASVWLKTELLDVKTELLDTAEEKIIDLEGNVAETSTIVKQEPIRKTLLLPKSAQRRQYTKEFKCEQCEYTTVYKNCLDLHVLGHADTKGHRCTQCSFATKLPNSLQRHIKTKHTVDVKPAPTVNCHLCDYTTVYKWNLRSHMRKHSEDKLYKCTECEYVTAYKHNYQKHAKTHAKGKNVVFKCDKCHFKTKFMGHITRHLAKIHNEITETAFRCAHCDFSTVTKWRLTIHLHRSGRKELIRCNNCGFASSYACEMKKHRRDEHYNLTFLKTVLVEPSDMKNEKTEQLEELTESSEVREETKDQLDEVEYEEFEGANEEDCNKPQKKKKGENFGKYNTSPDCVDWKSIKVLESEDKSKPFQCISCKYSSRFKASVQRHYQRHHTGDETKPYQCINCDFCTKTKDQIALHNKRSKSGIVLNCKECSFQTKFKCTLVMHQKSHYAYSCSECNYKCKIKYDLSRHYNYAHLNGVWKCKYCDYKAPRRDGLLAHETIHTGYKPYSCGLCSYTSVRKSLLNVHLRRFHSDTKTGMVVVSKDKIDALKIVEDNEDEENNLLGFEGLIG
ncbi:hypothetical protein evm_003709 [Chilo suppressalis]|nr:hypothetical protein evm_003709 [Chilo suppressalis]